jgi:hypothetical protein
MKCTEAQHWIMTQRPAAAATGMLARHLRHCARCRRRRRRVRRLDAAVALAPVSPSCAAALDRFLACVPELPRRPKSRLRPWLFRAAAVLAFVGMTALLLQLAREPGPDEASPAVAASRPGQQLLVRLLERDLRLAGPLTPEEQLHVLAGMVDDLRHEAVRLACDESADEVDSLTRLHDWVLRRGLLGRAAALPLAQRADVLPALSWQLEQAEKDMAARARRAGPSALELLLPLQTATLATRGQLGQPPEAGPRDADGPALPDRPGRHVVLAALVRNGLRLAEDADPLRRADYCSDIVDHLLQAVVTASRQPDGSDVSTFTRHVGAFVDHGISANLAQVSQDDPRRLELQHIRQRAARTLAVLDQTLADLSTRTPSQLDVDRLKDLERVLKDVEKDVKRAHKNIKDRMKGKDGKGKS